LAAQQQAEAAAAHGDEDPNKLYCVCRKPYQPGVFMIGCDVCLEWYHGDCVGVQE
jgi:hypothetical protein